MAVGFGEHETIWRECAHVTNMAADPSDESICNPGTVVTDITGNELFDLDSCPIYACSSCNRVYRTKSGISKHTRLECGKEPIYQCEYCNRKFHHNTSRTRHLKIVHRIV